MPYQLAEENGRYCVKKGNETMKCYDDKGKAMAYFRALQANVHDGLAEFSMAITKATMKDGVMRFRSVNSDIDEDYYGERMSKELFQDFIAHIENNDPIPEPFKSVIAEPDWDGGMPYLSIAHYKSGEGRKNVPGEPSNVYLDGKALKSTGILYDTPLGRAVFKSLQKDLVEKRDDKIRVSIGFLDTEHTHGDKYTFTRKSLTDKCPLCKEGVGDKIYKKGHLVHLALTRVPANPRTDVEVEKSMTTKREDAESIIEDEEVIKGLDLKSQAEDVLVIKSDNPDDEQAEDKKKKKKDGKEEMDEMHKEMSVAEPVVEPVAENTVFTEPAPVEAAVTQTPTPVYEPTPVEQAFVNLKSKIVNIKSQGLTGDKALAELQSDFDKIGEVIKAEFTPAPTPEEVAAKTLETTLRSLLGEMLPAALASTVAPIQSELESLKSELRAKSLTEKSLDKFPKQEKIETVQRSLAPSVVQQKAIEQIAQKSISKIDLIARQSVGLQ